MFLNAVRGFCMALADSVPGVSGGTIAFLLGFYDEFINSLNDLMGRDSKKRKKAFLFLVKLGIGWIIGFGLSVLILASLFEAHIYQISSVFFGLTLFAIPMVIKEEAAVIKGQAGNLVFTLLGAALVFAISWFNPSGGEGIRVSADQLSFGFGHLYFLCCYDRNYSHGTSGNFRLYPSFDLWTLCSRYRGDQGAAPF